MNTMNNINKIFTLLSKEIKKPYFLIILLLVLVITLYITFYLYKEISEMYKEVDLELFSIASSAPYPISEEDKKKSKNNKLADIVSKRFKNLIVNFLN